SAGLKTLSDNGMADEAVSLFQKYLAIGRSVKAESNFKLHSSKEDRKRLNALMDDLQKNSDFAVKLGSFKPIKLSPSGWDSGALSKNYQSAKRFFKEQAYNYGTDRVVEILNGLLDRMSVVQIDVVDPTNGPKIFDSLNSRQEPMTVGDLVRNEIFSRVSDLGPEKIDYIDTRTWQPFYESFKINETTTLFESYFFPYGLIQNPNLNKSQVYGYLRKDWEAHDDPAEIINKLASYQDAFLDLMTGSNRQDLSKDAAAAVKRFKDFGFPASALPFLMQLTKGMADRSVELVVGVEMLSAIEAFLIRRALCGIEPTGLHAVFRRLWEDTKGDRTAGAVVAKIKDRTTVTWPDDDFVSRSIRTRALYGSSIASFVIRQYDESLGGDVPANVPWIEHVLPRNPDASWDDKFDKDQRAKVTNLWANLIPLSEAMNGDLSNAGYSIKRPVYEGDAMFKSARKFATDYSDWTPEHLEARAEKLVDWALSRWPG
ncbi:MAG: HNH endonuclease family protein, partial [Hyphomicrobiales bacterium]